MRIAHALTFRHATAVILPANTTTTLNSIGWNVIGKRPVTDRDKNNSKNKRNNFFIFHLELVYGQFCGISTQPTLYASLLSIRIFVKLCIIYTNHGFKNKRKFLMICAYDRNELILYRIAFAWAIASRF